MASRKGKRSSTSRPEAGPRAGAGTATADRTAEKRRHREDARLRREAIQRGIRRRHVARRVAVWAAGLAAIGAIGVYVLGQELESRRLAGESGRLAAAAGCTDVVEMPDLRRSHLPAGQTTTYDQHPATSGTHALAPLPPDPHVYPSAVDETAAVHNLEHGYVLIYYRSESRDALPGGVVKGLADLANGETKVIMAPYPELEKGTALAFAAWDELQQCPAAVTAEHATGLADAFIARFRAGGRAPEPSAP